MAQAGGWPRREVEHYNHGFANRTLWPQLHGPIEQRVFEGRWWTAYCDVNEGFAAVEASRRRLRWVHDYHLMLVPSLLRRARVREPIGSSCTRTSTHAISIGARALAESARSAATERSLRGLRAQFGGRRILLGVDRLDCTKGSSNACGLSSSCSRSGMGWPAGVSRLSGSPSRGEVREYRELRRNVEELVGRINGRFTDPGGDVPVHYELDDDRRRRIERMAACVVRRDVYWWTEQELAAAEEARRALAA